MMEATTTGAQVTVITCSLEDLRLLIRMEMSSSSGSQAVEIIDRVELCKRLDINQNTAITWEKKGKIPSLRIGNAVRYNWIKVVEALERKNKPNGKAASK